jgi:hypothetical protein
MVTTPRTSLFSVQARYSSSTMSASLDFSERSPDVSGAIEQPSAPCLRPNGTHDPVGDGFCFLVRPEAENAPPEANECLSVASVACDVSFNFLAPILRVRPGLFVMRWAAVPKAAIDEHSHPGFAKDHVGGACQISRRARADAEAQASPVRCRAHSQLGTSVPRAVSLHHAPNRRGTRP